MHLVYFGWFVMIITSVISVAVARRASKLKKLYYYLALTVEVGIILLGFIISMYGLAHSHG